MDAGGKPTLVALRRERERTIETLTEAFSTDELDVEQFEHRVDLAHQATDLATLEKLTSDLGITADESKLPAPMDEATSQALIAARPRRRNVIAIMSGTERKGQWRVPETMRVVAMMGGVELDFREAALAPGVTSVHVFAMMGGVDIIVPPTLAVECEGAAVMGSFVAMERAPLVPDPDEPLLRITGTTMMGSCNIVTRLPGESARQASRRERKERKEKRQRALDEHRGRQLPP